MAILVRRVRASCGVHAPLSPESDDLPPPVRPVPVVRTARVRPYVREAPARPAEPPAVAEGGPTPVAPYVARWERDRAVEQETRGRRGTPVFCEAAGGVR
ncbi:hypothetical protein LP52_04555 [Streptomonospora alba]|uniref:Uncharacterized protein n=1 Tax=Streptomonospora alba TaxID=183763 RepID=A0A0C2JEY4_9ACTN|nr:hypothetical protein LP52_04555 [Streptomonospora alba]